jgi:hypothetical protein
LQIVGNETVMSASSSERPFWQPESVFCMTVDGMRTQADERHLLFAGGVRALVVSASFKIASCAAAMDHSRSAQ